MDSVVACGNCHTPKGPDGKAIAGMELAGGNPIKSPVFQAIPANITPEKETGIGAWTDARSSTPYAMEGGPTERSSGRRCQFPFTVICPTAM